MTDKCLLDTNILLYAFGRKDKRKRDRSRKLYSEMTRKGTLHLSTQNLNEFFHVSTRKIGLSPNVSRRVVEDLCNSCVILSPTPRITLQAIDYSQAHSMQFWDALLVALCAEHGIKTLYTEDFQHNRTIDGVTIKNPLK